MRFVMGAIFLSNEADCIFQGFPHRLGVAVEITKHYLLVATVQMGLLYVNGLDKFTPTPTRCHGCCSCSRSVDIHLPTATEVTAGRLHPPTRLLISCTIRLRFASGRAQNHR